MGEDRSFSRDGLTFHVRVGGPESADHDVVLLHGFPGSARTWAAVEAPLHAAGLRTYAPTQRGYLAGARPHSVGAYRIEELADDVLALADTAGLSRFHVVGHDWGGVVAWYLADRHAARLRSLSVLSTPHPRAMAASMLRGQLLRSWYVAAFQLPALPEALLSARGARALQAALTRSGLDEQIAHQYVEELRGDGGIRAAINWYRAAARHQRGLRSVGAIAVPTLYVWSSGDIALGAHAARATGQHVSAPYRFVVLDGVSHWIPEMAPERTAELVTAHVLAH